jgi:1,4-alpha-glucan branching enzyme
VPTAGAYREAINTDGAVYGGSGVGNGVVQSSPVPWHGKDHSIVISVPPLATVMWVLA